MLKHARIVLAYLLALSLVLPAAATAMPAKKSAGLPAGAGGGVRALVEPDNNDLAGSEVLTSTAGSLNRDADAWDTYYVDLLAGEKVSVKLTAGSLTDFDIWLYSPAATTTADFPVFSSANDIYPESLTYVAPVSGRYYIGLEAAAGAGNYSLLAKVQDAEDDDDLPGVALPDTSPFTGFLDRYGDQDDVYAFQLEAGETFMFSVAGPSTTDFDAFIFSDAASSVYSDDPVLASDGLTSVEGGSFTATETGTYYLDVYSAFGAGNYTVRYDAGELSLIDMTGPATIKYGATAVLEGSLTATDTTPRVGETVTLQYRQYGWTNWHDLTTATVDAGGNFAFPVKPTVATQYRAWFENDEADLIAVASGAVTVKPGVSLTVPSAPSVARRGVYFTTGGFLRPRHTSGSHTVKVYAQRYERQRDGRYKWVTRKIITTTNSNYGSYSRYRARVALPSAGRWRLQAISPTTAKYAYTKTPYRYFSVK